MYEDMTFDFILQSMLDRVSSAMDKREGSVIYDALAPAALELAIVYSKLDTVIDETFADTASREMLIKRAAERGLNPRLATAAVVRGEFNTRVALGTRFSLDESRFYVDGELSDGYKLVCESVGREGNRIGTLTPLDYIDGLTYAAVTEILIPGEDDEDTEEFRKRYFDSLEMQSFGGNVADYREKVLTIAGTGGVKVYPTWNGGGTVKLVIQDYLRGVPTPALIDEIKTVIDPSGVSGLGEGLAPIGHSVTVIGVEGVEINVSAEFVTTEGWSFADSLAYLEKETDTYLYEVSCEWDKSEYLVVRLSQLEARLLNAAGILDIINLKINGFKENVIIGADSIPIRGVITDVG